jgi:WD40 repeat protein
LRWNKKTADWRIHILTPTAHPVEQLAVSLTNENPSISATTSLMDDLARDDRSLQIFARRKLGSEKNARLLLVIDQFEEIFTLCRSEEERDTLIRSLLTASSEADGAVAVVITLRADFYAHCANYIQLREALAQNQEYIGSMDVEELRQAIEVPAQRGRWEFESGLVDLLLHEVGREPGALPLLSHALLETWQRRRNRTMTLGGYASSGGVRGAIAETAETVFTDQFTHEQQAIARRIFLRLTELGDEMLTGDTRRRAKFNELILKPDEAASTNAVLKSLADARLITTGEDSVEVAHEALIREWPTLRGWLEDNREGLRLQRQFTDAAQEWQLMEREPDMLYRGARLAQLREWAQSHTDEMNILEHEFLNASVEANEREALEREAQRLRELEAAKELAETQRQSAVRLRIHNRVITTVGILAVILAILAGTFGLQSNQNAITAQNNAVTAQVAKNNALNAQATSEANRLRAENEKQIAFSRELAGSAIENLTVDPQRSILLALHALSESYTQQAEQALHRSVLASLLLQSRSTPGFEFGDPAFSPDGTRIVITGCDLQTNCDNTLHSQVLDATTLETLFTMPGFFAGSRWTAENGLVTISPAGDPRAMVVTFWDDQGRKVSAITMPIPFIGPVWTEISPDRTRIGVMTDDNVIKVWDLTTSQELQTFSQAEDVEFVFDPFFTSDGKYLLIRTYPYQTKLLNIDSGQEVFSYPIGGISTFAPDGKSIAIIDSLTFKLWDAASGQKLYDLPIEAGFVRSRTLQFSVDSTRLVTVMTNGKAQVWNTTTGLSLLTLYGVARDPCESAISPDNARLLVVTCTGQLQLWGISPESSREWLTVPVKSEQNGVALSPDGARLAVPGPDNTIQVRDAASGQLQLTLTGHTGAIHGLAFSPDGMRLATSSRDHTAKVWDVTTGKELLTLVGHTAEVDEVVFSPDGTQIATIGYDQTARLWEADSGRLLFTREADFWMDTSQPIGIAFSPDGRYLATAGGPLIIWDTASGKEYLTPPLSDLKAISAAFSPDGKRLAVGMAYGVASVWDVASGTKLFDLAGHTGSVLDIAFSADGTRIATGSTDNTAKLWDAATGIQLLTLIGHTYQVDALAFSPDGTRLTTVSYDGTIRVWALRLEDLVQIARSRLTRELTANECLTYLHVKACPFEP